MSNETSIANKVLLKYATFGDDGINDGWRLDIINEVIAEIRERIENKFKEYRFGPETHLGLGDIRMTVGMQDDLLKSLE
jgi:hypothetical protein